VSVGAATSTPAARPHRWAKLIGAVSRSRRAAGVRRRSAEHVFLWLRFRKRRQGSVRRRAGADLDEWRGPTMHGRPPAVSSVYAPRVRGAHRHSSVYGGPELMAMVDCGCQMSR